MLPTHIIRMPNADEQDGDAAAHQADSSMSYPPPSSTVATGIANGSMASSRKFPSLWNRVLGPRGIVGLTVDVAAPPPKPTKTTTTRNDAAATTMPSKSRWNTWEFYFYYLVFLIVVPQMVYVPYLLSRPDSNPQYPHFQHHLEPGWLFGRRRDDSDFQYRSFRDKIPMLLGIMTGYLVLSWALTKLGAARGPIGRGSSSPSTRTQSKTRPNRKLFLYLFTTCFIVALHGVNTLKILLILLINYGLAKTLAGHKRIAPLFIWTFNVGTLAVVHWHDGFQWHKFGHGQLGWLDDYSGLLPRWQINFNITMLRLVSFALDLNWASMGPVERPLTASPSSSAIVEEPGNTNNKERAKRPRPLSEYSLSNYLVYALYPPLFIAGPIMSFNDFTSQLYERPTTPFRTVVRYSVRLFASLLTMEFVLHFLYVNAIKDESAWQGETPFQLSMVGFWNLIIVWMKLLLPWRFFRLWALSDGVDPPENMVRCMANNYSTLGFWRSWHRSYNLWIVRYIYIPMGGGRNTYGLPATLLVFTFVALWHDLSLKLLTWGWLVTLFIIPELLGRALVPASKFGKAWWYRHLCACGGVFNILLMMTANLVGFAIGTEGIQYMWQQLLGSWSGISFFLLCCGALFVATQVMFEYREEELRKGIVRNC